MVEARVRSASMDLSENSFNAIYSRREGQCVRHGKPGACGASCPLLLLLLLIKDYLERMARELKTNVKASPLVIVRDQNNVYQT